MAEMKAQADTITATVIGVAYQEEKATQLIFLIGDYVITIDTTKPGAARWDYLKNCIFMNPDEGPPNL